MRDIALDGFSGIMLSSCMLLDINECQTNNGGCQHNCSNSVGSFQCSCLSGYALDSDDLRCSGKISCYL